MVGHSDIFVYLGYMAHEGVAYVVYIYIYTYCTHTHIYICICRYMYVDRRCRLKRLDTCVGSAMLGCLHSTQSPKTCKGRASTVLPEARDAHCVASIVCVGPAEQSVLAFSHCIRRTNI